jgi:hypothetical protein
MTRINAGIPPSELVDKHLLAEHREIKRIPNVIRKGKFNMDNQPKEFKLGSGHVKFFYDKLEYLRLRYNTLYDECIKRGFNVTYYGSAWNDIDSKYFGNYQPTENDIKIIKERINERLKTIKIK